MHIISFNISSLMLRLELNRILLLLLRLPLHHAQGNFGLTAFGKLKFDWILQSNHLLTSVTDVYVSQVSSSREDCQRKIHLRTTGFGRTGFHLDEEGWVYQRLASCGQLILYRFVCHQTLHCGSSNTATAVPQSPHEHKN